MEYKDFKGYKTLLVVKGKGPTLVGKNWSKDMMLDWKSFSIGTVGIDDQRRVKGYLREGIS